MNTGYGSKGDQGNHHGGSHHFDWSGNIVYYLKTQSVHLVFTAFLVIVENEIFLYRLK